MNVERMAEQLTLHEGERLLAYLDTEDNWTIGVGYNMSGRGLDALEQVCGRKLDMPYPQVHITRVESQKMLRVDINRLHAVIPHYFPEYADLSEIRQRVVLDMAFNMGFKALGFKKTIEAIKRRDWTTAVREMWKSKWARQVSDGPGKKTDRCDRLTKMLLTDTDYTN